MTKPTPLKLLELFKAISELESAHECQKFLEDLCTPTELDAMSDRWAVAKLLSQEIPYRKIYEQTGTSTATVTRVARALSEGAGYQILLNRKAQSKSKSINTNKKQEKNK
jgi:TrpR-related protein YerC/YecD